MNARGERVLIFGDSLTHAGSDNGPEIATVTADMTTGSSPGTILGALLAQQGAVAVQTDSRVGRSAVNFFGREDAASLFAADQAFAPTQVIVFLGTNDIGMDPISTANAMNQIKSTYESMGAKVWAIGPVNYVAPGDGLNEAADTVFNTMKSVFGTRMLDARPLTINVSRASDGVHFGPESAQQTALNLADGILSLNPLNFWPTLLIGLGVMGAAVVGLSMYRKKQGQPLFGLNTVSDKEYWASMKARAIPISSTTPQPPKGGRKLRGVHGVGDRISLRPAHEMTDAQIGKELDKLHVQRGRMDSYLLESGESLAKVRKTNAPIGKRLRAIEERENTLSREYSSRRGLKGVSKTKKKATKKPYEVPEIDPEIARKYGLVTSSSPPAAMPPAYMDPAEISTRDFDTIVQRATNAAPQSDGFGPRKVFIHRVYERARREDPAIDQMSLEQFKRRLAKDYRKSKLRMARADLVSAMNPDDIKMSKVEGDGSTFNFLERD